MPILEVNRLVIAVEINAEQFSNHKIYDWISTVLHAVLQLHKLNVYCVVGIAPNTFPKVDLVANATVPVLPRAVSPRLCSGTSTSTTR